MTDKGNVGATFYLDGRKPGDAIAEWNDRVTQVAIAAKAVVAQRYGKAPQRTYAAGISNGGYLVRWQLENQAELYDGGVDWEGTLWRTEGDNLLNYLPHGAAHPAYPDGRHPRRCIDAGFAKGSEFLWHYHYQYYWDLTQRVYREELDPSFDGDTEAGTPFCASGTPACDADYDYDARKPYKAMKKIGLTGKIGKPLITIHGDAGHAAADLPFTTSTRTWSATGPRPFRYYRITDGNHVDSLADVYPSSLRPILPCYRDAFTALEAWVEDEVEPPASGLVRFDSGAPDVANSCSVADR